MNEALARELIEALRENTAAVTRAAVANEGVVEVLREAEGEEEQSAEPASPYL